MRMPYSIGQFKAVLNGLGYCLNPSRLGTSPSLVENSDGIELDVYIPTAIEAAIEAAIEEFQAHYKLPLTGISDLQTQEKARQLIRNLQHSLNLTVNAQLPISEFYGDGTTNAVELFQAQHGLPITGIASVTVRQALEAAVKRQLRQQLNCLITPGDPWQIV